MLECLWGAFLAGLHFGGLWWTVRWLPSGKAGLSRAARLACTGMGLGILVAGGPGDLLLGLAGFLAVRNLALLLAPPPGRGEVRDG